MKQGATPLIYLWHNYFTLDVSFSFATGNFFFRRGFYGATVIVECESKAFTMVP